MESLNLWPFFLVIDTRCSNPFPRPSAQAWLSSRPVAVRYFLNSCLHCQIDIHAHKNRGNVPGLGWGAATRPATCRCFDLLNRRGLRASSSHHLLPVQPQMVHVGGGGKMKLSHEPLVKVAGRQELLHRYTYLGAMGADYPGGHDWRIDGLVSRSWMNNSIPSILEVEILQFCDCLGMIIYLNYYS